MPKIAALATTVLKIKPILSVHDGEAHPVTNPRTNNGAVKRILELMKETVVKGQPLHVAVMHANAPDRAIMLRMRLLPDLPVLSLSSPNSPR